MHGSPVNTHALTHLRTGFFFRLRYFDFSQRTVFCLYLTFLKRKIERVTPLVSHYKMNGSLLFYIYSGLLFLKLIITFFVIIKCIFQYDKNVDFNFSVTQFFVPCLKPLWIFFCIKSVYNGLYNKFQEK